eukprot:TRINITY_DN12002_c1_g8_i2.p1 TRINITY_DN12002_c1_g8~~TRINITY_DN12002_c1_g8_i2.p1  ORF type:complete len:109 (+),score=4.37 TRINITY_DN12002_c1_g8_i2:295-621(+)
MVHVAGPQSQRSCSTWICQHVHRGTSAIVMAPERASGSRGQAISARDLYPDISNLSASNITHELDCTKLGSFRMHKPPAVITPSKPSPLGIQAMRRPVTTIFFHFYLD